MNLFERAFMEEEYLKGKGGREGGRKVKKKKCSENLLTARLAVR